MTARIQVVPYGPQATEALAVAIGDRKGGDPLAPVSVVPASTVAGLSLRHALAARGGLVNTRFLPLARVAELLGAPPLAAAGRRPLTGAIGAGAVRRVLREEPGVFADVADHAATERALEATFADLRSAPARALDRLAATSERAADVVRLYRSFRAITAPYYDEHDLALAAAEAVETGSPALADVGAVVLHLPRGLRPGDLGLVDALAAAGRLSAVIGLTGDPEADAGAEELADRLAAALGPPQRTAPGAPPHGHRLRVVPDPEEEVRAVARDLTAHAAEGTALHEIAVVSPTPDRYRQVAADVFADAGILHHARAGLSLAHTVAGRTLLVTLRLADDGYPRRAVMAWLHDAPVVERPGRSAAAADRWERRSREAGVTSGRGQWLDRLGALSSWYERQRARKNDTGDDPREPARAAERAEVALAEITALRSFMAELFTRSRPPRARTWGALADWAHGLLRRYLGPETAHADWPEHEVEALRRVEEAVDALRTLDDVDPGPDPARFRHALERELEAPAARTTRFGDGVFVGGLGDAVGATFEVVYVVGMVEGTLPPRSPDDALLPDHERLDAEGLPLRTTRRADTRRDLLAALAGRRLAVCSYPRTDPRSQRDVLPAPWLVDTASALAARRLFAGDLDALDEPWLERVPSIQAGVERGEPGSRREYDLRSLLAARAGGIAPSDHYLCAEDPALAAGFAAIAGRRGDALSPWDGGVGELGGALDGHSLAPTTLEAWARCPMRYFLDSALGVRDVTEPEDVETLSALDRGSLVHAVLEDFVRERGMGRQPEEAWTADDRRRLVEIAEEHFAAHERRGLTGRPLLWELERRRILRTLERTLDEDERWRREQGVAPVAVEVAFGDGRDLPAVEVAPPGRRARPVRLGGVIDRVDASPDRSVVAVLDYKTGGALSATRADPFADDAVRRGTALQLPVYALAARQAFPGARVSAHYWYLGDRGGWKREGYELTDERRARFEDVLGVIASGIEAGVFPARPGGDDYDHRRRRDSFENCTFCPYDRLCPADRDEAWDRRRHDPALAAYVELAEGER